MGLEGQRAQDGQQVLPDTVQAPVGQAQYVNRLVAGVSQLGGASGGDSLVKDSQVRIRMAFLCAGELITPDDGASSGMLYSAIPGVLSSLRSHQACSMCTTTKPDGPAEKFLNPIQPPSGIQQGVQDFGWARARSR